MDSCYMESEDSDTGCDAGQTGEMRQFILLGLSLGHTSE